MFDCLYVNGDSWVYGSELLDPTGNPSDHFSAEHDRYRTSFYWPRLVANSLGLELFDGSLAGSGNDRILRTSVEDLSNLIIQGRKPLAVVAWSQLHRMELPLNELYTCYVSPNDSVTPNCVREIWGKYSSDRTDLFRWALQMISLDGFMKSNSISYLATTVFKENYWLFEKHVDHQDFAPYLSQLISRVGIRQHLLNNSLSSVLKLFPDVKYGPGGHPLEQGQVYLAEHIEKHLRQRFNFNKGTS